MSKMYSPGIAAWAFVDDMPLPRPVVAPELGEFPRVRCDSPRTMCDVQRASCARAIACAV